MLTHAQALADKIVPYVEHSILKLKEPSVRCLLGASSSDVFVLQRECMNWAGARQFLRVFFFLPGQLRLRRCRRSTNIDSQAEHEHGLDEVLRVPCVAFRPAAFDALVLGSPSVCFDPEILQEVATNSFAEVVARLKV